MLIVYFLNKRMILMIMILKMLLFQLSIIESIDRTPDRVMANMNTAIEIIICKNNDVFSPLSGNSCLRVINVSDIDASYK